jgi:ribosome-binding protein aMBF1 (putative translation factor)
MSLRKSVQVADDRGPRRHIERDNRELFGKAKNVPWVKGTGSPAELSAAYRQHLLACAVNQARRDNGWTIDQLAAHVGMRAETLRRKLRGEAWISWIDASTLALSFPEKEILPVDTGLLPSAAGSTDLRLS